MNNILRVLAVLPALSMLMLGCGQQEAEAPGDTQAVRANMVYYAMPG